MFQHPKTYPGFAILQRTFTPMQDAVAGHGVKTVPTEPLAIPHGGEVNRLVAEKDWSQTRLGTTKNWSPALKLSVQLILASGFPMSVRWGPDLIMIYNNAYAPILGDKHPRALGSPTSEVWPEIYDELGPLHQSILRGERKNFFARNYLWKVRRHGGAFEKAYFTISYSPILDPGAAHGIGGILVTAAETSEEVHRERRLRQLTARLEHEVAQAIRERDRIWQLSEDLLGVSNFEGYFLNVNPAWTALLGWSEDEIKRMHVSDLRHPDDAPESTAQRERLANGVPTVRMENRFRHKDGSWRWLNWTLTAEKDQIYVNGRHVTAEKEAAERLHESDRQFRLLVDAVIDYALYRLTPDGLVSSWNIGAQRIKGYRADEIIGQHFSRFYTPEDRQAEIPGKALRMAATNGRFETEGWRVRKDGTQFWASVVIDAIYDEKRSLIGFAKITRDITERREAQIRLQRMQEQLAQSQKMDALGQLTGGIAHDFNNMLMIVGGYTQYLKGKVSDPKDTRAVEAVELAVSRAEKLTRQLLTFSRRQPLKTMTVCLAECLQNFMDVLTASISGNIQLDMDLPNDLWPVTIDPNEFEAAIINLLVNARDAMPHGGTIRVTARNEVFDQGEKMPRLKGEFVVIDVHDDGVGIPPENLPKIFDPFFTTKDFDKGTGLGLSQVYGFAHQAGGTVTVSSNVGIGTTFSIFLPRAKQRAAGGPDCKTDRESPRGDELILVVEDNVEVRSVVTTMLGQLGYTTMRAEDARQALSILQSGPHVDLVLTDVLMRGALDGLGLARQLRQHMPRIPVLLTTGYAKTLQEPFAEFPILRKPYDLTTLAQAVRQAINRSDPATGQAVNGAGEPLDPVVSARLLPPRR